MASTMVESVTGKTPESSELAALAKAARKRP
jgi:hypothetical protein